VGLQDLPLRELFVHSFEQNFLFLIMCGALIIVLLQYSHLLILCICCDVAEHSGEQYCLFFDLDSITAKYF
jgi:hypothetical protein